MTDVLDQGRLDRLCRCIEIVEACQELGERLDLEVIAEVIDALEAEHARAAQAVPSSARQLTVEEQSLALVLSVIGGALENSIAYLERKSDLYRLRKDLDRVRKELAHVLWTGLFSRLPQSLAVPLAVEATAWRFVVLSRDEAESLPALLRQLTDGQRVTTEMREAARKLHERMASLERRRRKVEVG